MYDVRLIEDDFEKKLKTFNIESIHGSREIRITYLDEILSLTDNFIRAEEQASQRVEATRMILTINELQTSVSTFTKAIEHFLYSDANSNNQMSSSVSPNITTSQSVNQNASSPASTEASATQGESQESSTATSNMSTGESSDETGITKSTNFIDNVNNNSTTGSSAETTESTTNGNSGNLEANNENLFFRIQNNIQILSSNSLDFGGQIALETTELIYKLLESDLSVLFGKLDKKYLTNTLTMLYLVTDEVSTLIKVLASSAQIQNTFSMMDETLTELKSIDKSFTKIVLTQRGSPESQSIISNIMKILGSFSNAYSISSEDIVLLRSSSYQLSVASTSNNTISINDTDLASVLSSAVAVVQSASNAQSTLLTGSKLSYNSESSKSPLVSFESFKTSQQSSSFKNIYNEEETQVIKEVSAVSQQFYILQQFSELLSASLESLQQLYNTSSAMSGSFTQASTESPNTTQTSQTGVSVGEETESEKLFHKLTDHISICTYNIYSLEFDMLVTLATYLRKINILMSSYQEINLTSLQKTIDHVYTAKIAMNETIIKYSTFASVSQGFLNLQEASSSMQKLIQLFQSFDSLSINETNGMQVDETTLKHIQILTNYVIQFSLQSSTVSEESMIQLKDSFSYFESTTSVNRFIFSENKLLKHFLLNSGSSTSKSVSEASKGFLVKSQTQHDLFINKKAMTVIDNYISVLDNLTDALNGEAESFSPARPRLQQILTEVLQSSKEWSKGIIESNKLSKLESFINELSELVIILVGSALPQEVFELRQSFENFKTITSAVLSRLDEETLQDIEDSEIDAKLEYFSQMTYFLQTYFNEDDVTTPENVENVHSNTTAGNDISMNSTSGPQNSSTEQSLTTPVQESTSENATTGKGKATESVDYLLSIFETSYRNPLDITIEQIDSNFTSLMNEIQNDHTIFSYGRFIDLAYYVMDAAAYVEAFRSMQTYERADSTALDLYKSITTNNNDTMQESGLVIFEEDIYNIYLNLQDFLNKLYSVSRISIRKLQKYVYTIQYYLQIHGMEIGYLKLIDNNLILIQQRSQKMAEYAKKQYGYKRASNIFRESSMEIDNAAASLRSLIMSADSKLMTQNTGNETLRNIFYTVMNITTNFNLLPRNLGSIIDNFKFEAISIEGRDDLQYLKAIYSMITRLEECQGRANIGSAYIKEANNARRIGQVLTNALEKLKQFSSSLKDDNGTTNNTQVQIHNSTEATTTVDISSTTTSEPTMTYEDVLRELLNISEKLLRNSLQSTEDELEELEFYSSLVISLSLQEGEKIQSLLYAVDRLSYISSSVKLVIYAYESALQVTESYSIIKEVRYINEDLKFSLQNTSEDQGIIHLNDIIVALNKYYQYFGKGFTFISQEDIDSVWQLTYELASLNNDTNIETAFNVSTLLNLIPLLESNIAEAEGVLSAHSYHYNKLMSEIQSEFHKTDLIGEIDLSISSQHSYLLFELDSILAHALDILNEAGSKSGATISNCSLSTLFGDISLILKFVQVDPEGIHISILYDLSELILQLETLVKNGTIPSESVAADFIKLIEYYRRFLLDLENIIPGHGRTCTQALIVQNAYGVVRDVTQETFRWIYGESDKTTANDLHVTEYSSSTKNNTENIVQSTTIAGVTGDSATNMANLTSTTANQKFNSTDSNQPLPSNNGNMERSLQKQFDDISDVLMYWTFDQSKISGESVIQIEYFMKLLKKYCLTVSGIHMWDQMLIYSNNTLSSIIQNEYQNIILERSRIEESLIRYSNALKLLRTFSKMFEEDGVTDSLTAPEIDLSTTPETGINSTMSSGVDDQTLSTETPTESSMPTDYSETQAENVIVITDRIYQLMTLSRQVLGRWTMAIDIQRFEVSELNDYSSELSELAMAGGTLHDTNGNLENLIQDTQNFTQNVLKFLQEFAYQSQVKRSHLLHISFFKQIKQLLEYSAGVINLLRNEASGGSSGITRPSSNSSMSGSSSTMISGSTGTMSQSNTSEYQSTVFLQNSAMNCTIDELECTAEQLLISLQQLSLLSASGNTTNSTLFSGSSTSRYSSTNSFSPKTSTVSSLSTNNTSFSGNDEPDMTTQSREDEIQMNNNTNFFMKSHVFEQFSYQDIRSKVYSFARAMRKLSDETVIDYEELLITLAHIKDLIDIQLTDLETHIPVTTNVTVYLQDSFAV